MIGAFFYLQVTMVKNSLWQRVKRLREPKYLFGAAAGVAYFYFFVFSNALRSSRARPPGGGNAEFMATVEPFVAPMLFVVVVVAWVAGNSRAALQYTEAETAFLFPAPVSRRTLVNFKLLRAQLGILLTAIILTVVFRRGMPAGSALFHAAGWWVAFSTLSLHFIGASFARQRLLDFGLNPWRQRLLFGGILLALGVTGWLVVRSTMPAAGPDDVKDPTSLVHFAGQVFASPPISWVLAPFRWVARPYFAADAAAFALAMGPALLLLIAHYVWVVRSDVAFEEASIELAAKRAQLVADLQAGRWQGSGGPPKKPRPEPFRLRPRGAAPVAFLWKNLIDHGPFFRFRTWLIACMALAGLVSWMAADRGRADFLMLITMFGVMTSIGLLFGGPMFMRKEVQQTLTHLDITKAYPLPGWQIVLGQLLTPMVLMTFFQWFLLLAIVLSLGAAKHKFAGVALLGAGGAAGLTLVVPPLCGLLLCLPYAGVLYFPAWGAATPTTGGGGIEVMGQRLIFFAGYLLVLVVALLPAATVAALAFFIVHAFIGKITAFLVATLAASVVLTAELAGSVWFLGEKLERFDLSQEMPR